jgi:hypothetical protein
VERKMNMKCAKYGTLMKAKIISMVRKKEKTQARSNGKGFNGFQTKTKVELNQWESIQLCFKVLCPFIDH